MTTTCVDIKNSKHPCPICKYNCELDGILCDTCHNWLHYDCANLSKTRFQNIGNNDLSFKVIGGVQTLFDIF